MGYDSKGNRIKYAFAHDFGAGSDNYVFNGPKGKAGRLIDYGIEGVTETFNAVTTAATVSVGTVADPDAYGDELGLGTTAADAGSVSVRSLYRPGIDSGFATQMVEEDIPADTDVCLACTAPTGGTPAGIATAFAIIQWDD